MTEVETPRQRIARDVAACAALQFVLGDRPSAPARRLMTQFGYWDGQKLTEAGKIAAAEAAGE